MRSKVSNLNENYDYTKEDNDYSEYNKKDNTNRLKKSSIESNRYNDISRDKQYFRKYINVFNYYYFNMI